MMVCSLPPLPGPVLPGPEATGEAGTAKAVPVLSVPAGSCDLSPVPPPVGQTTSSLERKVDQLCGRAGRPPSQAANAGSAHGQPGGPEPPAPPFPRFLCIYDFYLMCSFHRARGMCYFLQRSRFPRSKVFTVNLLKQTQVASFHLEGAVRHRACVNVTPPLP